MRYEVEGDDLCIRIPLDAIAAQAFSQSRGEVRATDKAALARLLGQELVDCETPGEQPWLNATLDAAMDRVLGGYYPAALEYNE